MRVHLRRRATKLSGQILPADQWRRQNKMVGLVLDKVAGCVRGRDCGDARLQLCLSSSPMSRVTCVAVPRWRAGGTRNAAHGNSTRDC